MIKRMIGVLIALGLVSAAAFADTPGLNKRGLTASQHSAIKVFFDKSRVIEQGDLKDFPRVVAAMDTHIATGLGDKIYVKGLGADWNQSFTIVRQGQPYVDPETGKYLGFRAIYIGEARVLTPGDVAMLEVTKSRKEILVGDRLMVKETEFRFAPHAPHNKFSGTILEVLDAINQGGRDNAIAIAKGHADGVRMGDMVGIFHEGERIRDGGETITLPQEHVGNALVYKCYDHVSFALVMNSNGPVKVYDKVGTS